MASIWGEPAPKAAPPAPRAAAPVHHAAPAWEPAPAPPKPEPEPSPWGSPAPAPAPAPAASPLAPAGPIARPPPAAAPERSGKEGDVDLMDDEEMDDPDWYRDNEARVPCFKFGETGLYNLQGLKNFDRDWTVAGSSGEVSFNFCYYVKKIGCKPDDPESFAMEKQGMSCL